MKNLTLFIIVVFQSFFAISQDLTADEIIKNSEEKYRGKSSKITMTVTIERPKWSREMTLTSWNKGNEYSISVITAPAKDAIENEQMLGTALNDSVNQGGDTVAIANALAVGEDVSKVSETLDGKYDWVPYVPVVK